MPPPWVPIRKRADEPDAFRLQALVSRFDVVDEKPDDRSLREVGVLAVGGAEDLRLAAVWKPEVRELLLLELWREPRSVPAKVAISL